MDSAYKALAERLDELPNGFPPTDDGRELKILEKLFSPEEAALAAQLSPSLESVGAIAARTGVEACRPPRPAQGLVPAAG